jgi:hypothetical protein
MSADQNTRSVKIDKDERTGWSSDRPRGEGRPPRPVDISTRCTVLRPSDRLRYNPGSLVVVACAVPGEADAFVQKVIEEKPALLSLDKIRGLLAGRVDSDQIESKGAELLTAALTKRLDAGEAVVVATDNLETEGREPFARLASARRRPRHFILLETGDVPEDSAATLKEVRRALEAGDLGSEGFQTAMRIGGTTVGEVKKLVFRPPPRDD